MAYIDRTLVQKCLDDLSSENLIGNENDTFISLAEAKDRIEELPIADVVPKSEGAWVWKSNGYMNALHCSLCNRTAELHYNFCPNCGEKSITSAADLHGFSFPRFTST